MRAVYTIFIMFLMVVKLSRKLLVRLMFFARMLLVFLMLLLLFRTSAAMLLALLMLPVFLLFLSLVLLSTRRRWTIKPRYRWSWRVSRDTMRCSVWLVNRFDQRLRRGTTHKRSGVAIVSMLDGPSWTSWHRQHLSMNIMVRYTTSHHV